MDYEGLIQQSRGRWVTVTLHLLVVCSILGTACAGQEARRGYTNRIPPESPAAREARHKRVAERRAGPMALVHWGAWAFAPENTLEAYAAAMDYGLDGVEVDLRRTADGVSICMHDEWLGRLTDSWDVVQDHTYYDLLGLGVHSAVSAVQDGQFAIFAALLILARFHRPT
ncbi:MAG: glycerophosphodiester phosphodiesterase family protein [Armatimonadetes bacterium]|nr:glycerophosphodiester phosphodiesterase family protein [Armatimonadota bacterium]